jgi:predicted dehydrogenase
MKQVVQNFKTGCLGVKEVPAPLVRDGGVLVQNRCSLISAGTERASVDLARRSLIGKAKGRPDLVRQVLDRVQRDGLWETVQAVWNRLDADAPLGYSCAGVVLEVGRDAPGFERGDRVACAGGGYASHAEVVSVPRNLTVKVPEGVDDEGAAFATVGAIALQGLRVAEMTIGDRVGVIGLGLIGQIAVQLLAAAGCRVFGVDIVPERAALALRMGAAEARSGSDEEVAASVAAFTEGRGLDAVIITAASDDSGPVALAGEISRDKGRVVAVGAVKMEVPRRVYYEKELDLRLSRSYGPGRYDPEYEEKGIDYPFGYVRWTERRNMEAFVDLLARGRVDVRPLVTHRFRVEDASEAYDMIVEGREPCLGVLLTYDPPAEALRRPRVELKAEGAGAQRRLRGEEVGVGVIGAGNFARGTLLPALKRLDRVRLRGIVSAGGLHARSAGRRFGFDYCASDAEEIFRDEECDAVLIATRHHLHASLACRALAARKHVFVEKPLALNEAELKEVLSAARTSGCLLTVGFNRRFAPLVGRLKDHFEGRSEPLSMSYRVNAGPLPAESWVQDPAEGGGRIVGEVCHFVDLMCHLTGATPQVVYAQAIPSPHPVPDTLNVHLRFSDGSIGNICYWSNGDSSYPKEHLEVFSGGGIAVLNDFRELTCVRGGRRRRFRERQDKGHRAGLRAFIEAIRRGAEAPIPLQDAAAVTLTTFSIHESLRAGAPIPIPDATDLFAT